MGFMLLYEGMLDSIIFARDKFLKEDGLMFPHKATIFCAAFSDEDYRKQKFEFFTKNDYGLDFSALIKPLQTITYVDKIP